MTNHSHLPRLPLVDLGSNYLSHLEQIDVENQSRHYCGEPLLEYPTFEEFVSDCRDASFAAEPKVCAHVYDFTGFTRIHEPEVWDQTDLNWLLPLPVGGMVDDDGVIARVGAAADASWVTDLGSFAFTSTMKH